MKKIIAIAAGMALLAVMPAGPASAEGNSKWYGTVTVGMAFPGDAGASGTDADYGKIAGEYGLDSGFGFSGGIGYDLSPLRVEGVLSRFGMDIDSAKVTSIETPAPGGGLPDVTDAVGFKADLDGEASVLALMGNVWLDIDTGSALTPFVGGGVGMAQLDAEVDSVTVSGATVPVSAGGDDWVVAWQIGAGVGYRLSGGTTAILGYRFFDMGEADIDGTAIELDGAHIVEIGLRFSF